MSGNAKEEAFILLKRAGVLLRPLMEVADELDTCATLDEMTANSRARYKAAEDERHTANEIYAQLIAEQSAEIAARTNDIEMLKAEIADQADRLAINATEHADRMHDFANKAQSEAHKTAAKIIAKAQHDAEVNASSARIAEALRVEITGKIDEAQAHLDDLNAQIAAIALKFAK